MLLSSWRQQVVDCYRMGGIMAYPTEAVFGLGCCPLNRAAVHRLLAIKKRPARKGLILVAGSFACLQPYCAPLTTQQWATLDATWPGPVTWLVPKSSKVPAWISGESEMVALRVSNDPTIAAISAWVDGPWVSTSANTQGEQPAITAEAVRRTLGAAIDLLLPGEVGGQTKPSTIRHLLTGDVLRT